MCIHFSFNVIAVVYNTVIVAKSQCIFFYFSHNLAHFQKFIEALFIIIDMSSVLFRTVVFQENSHLHDIRKPLQLCAVNHFSPKLDKCVVKFS